MKNASFDTVEVMAREAGGLANARTAADLTKRLHDHLQESGLDQIHAVGNKVVYDEGEDEFRVVPNDAAVKLSVGTEDRPPTAALTTFWNHVDVVRIHKDHLFQASKDVGLI